MSENVANKAKGVLVSILKYMNTLLPLPYETFKEFIYITQGFVLC